MGYIQYLTRFPVQSLPVNLLRARKLRQAEFEFFIRDVKSVTTALQTITPKHVDFKQVTLHVRSNHIQRDPRHENPNEVLREVDCRQWMDLDNTLIQLQELHPICVKVTWFEGDQDGVVKHEQIMHLLEHILPKLTKKGVVKLEGIYLRHHDRSRALVCNYG